METSVFIVVKSYSSDEKPEIFSVWQYKADADREVKRLKSKTRGENFYVVEINLNDASDMPII